MQLGDNFNKSGTKINLRWWSSFHGDKVMNVQKSLKCRGVRIKLGVPDVLPDAWKHEIPYKSHKVCSITCQFDFQDSKNVLVLKCSPVEYNQSFFETFEYNTA